MTVRELICELLNYDMKDEIELEITDYKNVIHAANEVREIWEGYREYDPILRVVFGFNPDKNDVSKGE